MTLSELFVVGRQEVMSGRRALILGLGTCVAAGQCVRHEHHSLFAMRMFMHLLSAHTADKYVFTNCIRS